jgi:hypothetical protein
MKMPANINKKMRNVSMINRRQNDQDEKKKYKKIKKKRGFIYIFFIIKGKIIINSAAAAAADRKEKIYDSVRQKRSMDRWMDINKYFLFFTDGKAEKI